MATIACFGSGSGKPGDPDYDAMVEVGRLLAKAGHTIITGGFGGTGMEAPARGARQSGGECIGITLLDKPGNEFLTYVLSCAKFNGCDVKLQEIQFGIRLGKLLTANAFVVAGANSPGTITELMAAINLNVKWWGSRKRIAILVTPEEFGKMAILQALKTLGVLPETAHNFIFIATRPQEAVDWVTGQATDEAQS